MDYGTVWSPRKVGKMLPVTRLWGCGYGRRSKLLSGMILWNVAMLFVLLLAVSVQGREDSSRLQLVPRSSQGLGLRENDRFKKREAGKPESQESTVETTPVSKQSTNSQEVEGKDTGKDVTQPTQQSEAKDKPSTVAKEDSVSETTVMPSGDEPQSRMPAVSSEAAFRAFYVFVGVGAIILLYTVIKLARLRRRRAPGKYRVLSRGDDQEMFPLAAGEGEDEEIFNAAHHQARK